MKKLNIFFLASLFLCLFCAQAAVIGIDFGTEFFKISLISPGKSFVIIENTTSKRKTPTSISFVNGERVYEADAITKRSRNPQNTFVFVQKYLGALANDVKVLELAKQNFEDYLFDIDPDRNTIVFEIKNFKLHDEEDEEKVDLTIDEVTGMILKRAKVLAQKQGGLEIKDCVITVPSNWQANQKRALIDAAELAGLHVLGFINENTAGALYYGIERNDNQTHTVLFYNLGSSNLQVSLVDYLAVNSTEKSYKKPIETVKVIADTVRDDVSGLAFDHVLAQHFADVFDSLPSRSHKSSIKSSPSGMIKLLRECNRLKEVLSANKESPFYVENLFDGEDFKSHMDRKSFEEKAAHLFQKLTEPIDYVLQKANRTLKDVDRLEIVGGAVRIPKVQQVLNEYLQGIELGAHLNGDEAMAFGAAFHAANLSHSFKVRPLYLYDGNNFEIFLKIKDLEVDENTPAFEKNLLIFGYKQRFGSKKVVALSHDKNLKLELIKRNSEGVEELLTTATFSNISEISKNEKYATLGKPKLHFQFVLSSSWPTVDVEIAEATLEEVKIVEYEDVGSRNKKKPAERNSTTTDASGSSEEESTNSTETDGSNKTENSENTETEKKQKKKTITYYVPLKMEVKYEGFKGLSQKQIETSKKKLSEFDKHEEFLRKNSESKNKLESYLYKVRDQLSEEEFVSHASPIEKDQLATQMQENDDWLYSEEAFVSNHTEFNRRYMKMFSIASDIQHRVDEAHKRPSAIESAKTKIKDFEKKINDLNKSMPWVNETHKAPALGEIEKLREWIAEKTKLQESKPAYEDPVFTVAALEYRIKDIKEAYINLKNIKKPREKKKVQEKEDDEEKQEKEKEKEKEKNEKNDEEKSEKEEKKSHEHDQDLEEKNPEKEQISEREDL